MLHGRMQRLIGMSSGRKESELKILNGISGVLKPVSRDRCTA